MDLLTVEESAEFIHVPIATLRYWIQEDRICKSVKIGRRRYFRRADLEAWVEAKFNAAA